MFIFERERQRQREWERGRERGRHKIRSRPQALSCHHRTWCGARTHKPWDHDLSWSQPLNRLRHSGFPWNPIPWNRSMDLYSWKNLGHFWIFWSQLPASLPTSWKSNPEEKEIGWIFMNNGIQLYLPLCHSLGTFRGCMYEVKASCQNRYRVKS